MVYVTLICYTYVTLINICYTYVKLMLHSHLQDSGLSSWIGDQFGFLHNSSRVIIALVVSSFVAILTEFASNTASTTLLLPVLISLSQAIRVSAHGLFMLYAILYTILYVIL